MESQGGSSSGSAASAVISCKHNNPCAINTSWTGKNPGRKFYRCRYWKDSNKDCGFFKWVDAACSRDDDLIAQLKMEKCALERKVYVLEEKVANMKVKSSRRKEQLHVIHERMANMLDECVALVSEVRKVREVLAMLDRCVAYRFVVVITLIVFVIYSIRAV